MRTFIIVFLGACIVLGCNNGSSVTSGDIQENAQIFIDEYTEEMIELYYKSAKAEWKSNTEIIEDDTTNAAATRKANEAFAAFTGSEKNIQMAQEFLDNADNLTDIQVRQIEAILYAAANNPATVEDIVKKRIKAETKQTDKLYGFTFKIDDEEVTTNEIDRRLGTELDPWARFKIWAASKEVGVELKDGLENLRNLRNETVQALGYDDFFSYQVSEYGMSAEEMISLMDQLYREVFPLYRELHTYARYVLTEKYGLEVVPDMLWSHYLPNRWGQDWSAIIDIEGINYDDIFGAKSEEWIVEQGERFYISLGFPELPESFWSKSDLYPLPEDAGYKKNNHASAWHLDLNSDVRSLMSIEPNANWYETSHHELGHIYYYMTYTNEEVPFLLRGGANRGFHEAMGSLMGLAAMQKPFMQNLDLIPENAKIDEMQILLKEALNYIVFIPWSAGVMTHFEYELYANNLPKSKFNAEWWKLKNKYQGIDAAYPRGEKYCDAASKTHINNDAAQYYDYAISYILLFQWHDHIARNILKQDPHATNYFGSKEVGIFIHDLMYPGASRDWQELMQESLGESMSANAMLRYFEPLMDYLKKENEGRTYTLELLSD